MCDNKNELHKSEKEKTKRNTSTRLDLDITDPTDTYPEFDFLDLLRNLQVEKKKSKAKASNEESGNKSNVFSEDSEVEALARFYEEKYGTCNDYADLGEGYDEDDSFIDNSAAVNDLIPNGIQTEFGGFYINRGKLTFIKEDNSSNSASEDVDKFLSQNRLNIKKTGLDEENDERQKDSGKNPGNNNMSSNHISNNSTTNSHINNNCNSNNNNNDHNHHQIHNNNNNNNNNNSKTNNANTNVTHLNSHNNNSNCNLGNSTIKNRKRSGEFHHKSKKNRKTATPKIPDHLIHRKPFSGSSEFRKNINEIKKNRMKIVESDKKAVAPDLICSDSPCISGNTSIATTAATTPGTAATTTSTTALGLVTTGTDNNKSSNCFNNDSNELEEYSTTTTTTTTNNNNNNNNNNSNNNIDHRNNYMNSKKEIYIKKKAAIVKEVLKERDAASEVIEAVATGADLCNKSDERESSTCSETTESSSSDSESETSEEELSEKKKVTSRQSEELVNTQRNSLLNGIKEDFTAKNFAHLNDNLKSLIAKIIEISKEEKSKLSNTKLNSLLLRVDGRLRELPVSERNAVLELLATILQLKKESIIKRTKKLLFMQEETKMSIPLRKLQEAVSDITSTIGTNYVKECTKAAGARNIDPGSLLSKKFPWNDELRSYLREIIKCRENCYFIIRPRKESLSDYVKNFLETKLTAFWPKDWMTADILWEEGKTINSITSNAEDKHKTMNKMYTIQNIPNVGVKKTVVNVPTLLAGNKKQHLPTTSQVEPQKATTNVNKCTEVKSILIPRKTPQNVGNASKSNFSSPSGCSLQANNLINRLQVSVSKNSNQDYFEKLSPHSNAANRNPTNKLQSQTPPNRVMKSVTTNSVQNSSRLNTSRTTSPNSVNKPVPFRNCSNSQQNFYKTIEIHSKPVTSSKSASNSVTISPVTESMLKDISSSPEILNLTKNPSVCISKITDCSENKFNRSNSPSINRPLPSGITISATNAVASNFLTKPQKPIERTSDARINVSLMKQESGINSFKEKRESVLNMNVKKEGPFQNIPDCISVTSNLMSQEKYKHEHVRKRALQEYHHQQQKQQQLSPDRPKVEGKKIKLEENILTDMEIKEEKMDDNNFSKMFDSVIAKTSESVKHNENNDCQITLEKLSNVDGDYVVHSNNLPLHCSPGLSHYESPSKLRDMRAGKEKPYLLVKSDSAVYISDEKRPDESDDPNENVKELQVQKEMDRVMQNLVELSNQRVKDADYDVEPLYTSTSPSRPKSSYQEIYQKILYK